MPDPLVEVVPETALTRRIGDGEWVRIRTAVGSTVARAKFSRDSAPGTGCAQYGWWGDGPADSPYGAAAPQAANLNQAIDTSHADPVCQVRSHCALRGASWCALSGRVNTDHKAMENSIHRIAPTTPVKAIQSPRPSVQALWRPDIAGRSRHALGGHPN